jgi:pyruvate formate lyase activating enzyme
MTVEAITEAVLRDRAFYGDTGGLTLSGGEPLTHPAGAIALLTACREAGITTCVETCGEFSPTCLPAICKVTDLFLWDVKDTDPIRHRAYTGVDNTCILQNLREADRLGARTRLRCILVSGVNTAESHYEALATLYGELAHCEGIELIPYHAYGGSKMVSLGLADNGRVDWIPDAETVEAAKAYVAERGVRVIG